MKPPPRVSGTSAPKFPNRRISPHIRTYFLIATVCRASTKPLQAAIFHCALSSKTDLIAMQKVEGSNPFSRFTRDLALERDFVVLEAPKGNGTIPSYRLHFGH
jgi:hypothetical protein